MWKVIGLELTWLAYTMLCIPVTDPINTLCICYTV